MVAYIGIMFADIKLRSSAAAFPLIDALCQIKTLGD